MIEVGILEEREIVKSLLHPYLSILKEKTIVLASGSPRRRDILREIGLRVSLCPSSFEENLKPEQFSSFEKFVAETAKHKVLDIWNVLNESSPDADVIIGADTMVSLNNVLYGKPKDENDAKETLRKLSNNTSTVFSGVAVRIGNKPIVTYAEKANVHFGELTEEFIDKFVRSGHAKGKAGSFDIQILGKDVIKKVEGEYYTVIGLPLKRLLNILIDFAVGVK